jgi:hypothetical protein
MINFRQPILFKLSGLAPGHGTTPFRRMVFPPFHNTPFGRTDADLKQAPIPKPVVFALRSKTQVVRARPYPLPAPYLRISGITQDSARLPVAGCTVNLFRTSDKAFMGSTVSGADGSYEFLQGGSTGYFVEAVDPTGLLVGTTLNTLVGS